MSDTNFVHVCFAHYENEKVEKIECPNCNGEHDFLCQFEEWHGFLTDGKLVTV